jgi:hypothetical protein
MTAFLVSSLYFVGDVLLVMLVEELAKAGITKLKNSKTVKHQFLVFWLCLVFYLETRSRKNNRLEDGL